MVFLPKTHNHSADKAKLRDVPQNAWLALFGTTTAMKNEASLKACPRPEQIKEVRQPDATWGPGPDAGQKRTRMGVLAKPRYWSSVNSVPPMLASSSRQARGPRENQRRDTRDSMYYLCSFSVNLK